MSERKAITAIALIAVVVAAYMAGSAVTAHNLSNQIDELGICG